MGYYSDTATIITLPNTITFKDVLAKFDALQVNASAAPESLEDFCNELFDYDADTYTLRLKTVDYKMYRSYFEVGAFYSLLEWIAAAIEETKTGGISYVEVGEDGTVTQESCGEPWRYVNVNITLEV